MPRAGKSISGYLFPFFVVYFHSVYLDLDFSPDAVNVLVVYGSGSVFGYTIIDMECNWMQYEVITLQECSLLFRDYLNNIEESIEYPERILNVSYLLMIKSVLF